MENKYAKIKDGEVVYIGKLPKSTSRISNFDSLPDSELKEHGWLPVVRESSSLSPWQRKGATQQVIEESQVKLVETTVDKSLDRFKQEKIEQLQQKATNAILGTGQYSADVDPFLQQFDPQTAANAQKIKDVVDEYKTKKAEIESCTTLQEVDDVYIQIIAFVPPEDLDENGHIIQDEEI